MCKLEKQIEKGLIQILADDGIKFLELKMYLKAQYEKGNTDFRIAIQSAKHFIIHPFDKDGETIDIFI